MIYQILEARGNNSRKVRLSTNDRSLAERQFDILRCIILGDDDFDCGEELDHTWSQYMQRRTSGSQCWLETIPD